MNISKLLNELIVESKNDKQLVAKLHNKWKNEKNDLTEDEVDDIIEKFLSKKSVFEVFKVPPIPKVLGGEELSNETISSDEKSFLEDGFKQEVVTFLSRYDGKHQRAPFERPVVARNRPEYRTTYLKQLSLKLKDIRNYSYEQILFLLKELNLVDGEEEIAIDDTDNFDPNNLQPEAQQLKQYIAQSEALWNGSKNCIINEGDFRVYYIPDQFTSVKYGYYMRAMANLLFGGDGWCTARPYNDDRNYWISKRSNYTFYYVIDESRKPDINHFKNHPRSGNLDGNYLYYLSVIMKHVNGGFLLTHLYNLGESFVTENDLLGFFPKLRGHFDKFKWVDLNRRAESMQDATKPRISVSEDPNSQYEFSSVSANLKRAYIGEDRAITLPKSWSAMDAEMRRMYIDTINMNNIFDKLGTLPLISYIKSNKEDNRYLRRLLGYINFPGGSEDGIDNLVQQILKNKYKLARKGLRDSKMALYKNLDTRDRNGGFALFDFETMDFLRAKNIQYTPKYHATANHLWVGDDGQRYTLEVYTVNPDGSVDDSSFYCLVPISNLDETKAGGNFFSHKRIEELIANGKLVKPALRGARGKVRNLDFDSDVDLN